ncbi:MAG: hypothetical protein OHK0029_07890 [Armatimonadaceae bacterium]
MANSETYSSTHEANLGANSSENRKELKMAGPSETSAADHDNGHVMDRSAFVKVAIGGVCMAYAAAVGYPVYRYLASPVEKAEAAAAVSEVSLKDADKLPKGSAMMFKFGARPALLIHHQDDSWVALDAVCTHLACTVQYDAAQQKITCACHGGVYDAHTGENIAGPPPKPLAKYNLELGSGAVRITRA